MLNRDQASTSGCVHISFIVVQQWDNNTTVLYWKIHSFCLPTCAFRVLLKTHNTSKKMLQERKKCTFGLETRFEEYRGVGRLNWMKWWIRYLVCMWGLTNQAPWDNEEGEIESKKRAGVKWGEVPVGFFSMSCAVLKLLWKSPTSILNCLLPHMLINRADVESWWQGLLLMGPVWMQWRTLYFYCHATALLTSTGYWLQCANAKYLSLSTTIKVIWFVV